MRHNLKYVGVPALKICQLSKDLLQETPDDLPMEELTMPLRLVCVGFGDFSAPG
jgi:hypothetical protein